VLTILVPLDGSALAARVLPYVEELATLLDARVQLLHVLPERAQRSVADMVRVAAPRERAVGASQVERPPPDEVNGLLLCAERLRASGLSVTTTVHAGDASACIRGAANDLPDVLLALSANGWGGSGRQVAGHVAEAVVHSASLPVFLIHGASQRHAPWRVRRVFVPLPDEATVQGVLPTAAHIARAAGAELLLLRVVTTPGWFEVASLMECAPPTASPELAAAVIAAQAEVGALAQRLRREGIAATAFVAPGDPAVLIRAAAEELMPDLVVMATHGYGEARRVGCGSAADTMLHESTTPLLLLPAANLPPARSVG
jgi:nucleotide-binding universal stress UspA family protein